MNNRTNNKRKIDGVTKSEIEKVMVSYLDYFTDKYIAGLELKNSPTLRRVRFFRSFLTNANATRSAIDAGYSPKSARQQGYRVLQWLQREIAKGN